ncbi:radical SAM/SPASM domain-containing protein [Prosthecochloris sp. GSB1]|uniref:radical SAM protein n=1 Tax=Prosthecochloris sp. GSB1 TaxID=281093 RepID=UPI000B8CB9C0|nr:radical SAM protein [Prosthecochloris sp. GSB1]ASQ89926.1 radical SAM/SPASM domain-containing protein [Prosthecochloris sp. GSB1]
MSGLPLHYGELVRELQRIATERLQPLNGTFELTRRCNLGCRMCYVAMQASDAEEADRELSAASWLDIARQAKEEGTLFLLLTGGEIFLRPDFFDIYEPLTTMGFVISLYTNATLIDAIVAKRLAGAPPHKIEVSLYGATAETYEGITGVRGSFERCRKGVEALLEHGVGLSLKVTITRDNLPELPLMREMADQWGLALSASWMLTGRTDGGLSDVESCRLTPEEAIRLESFDSAMLDEWRKGIKMDVPENFYCKAGKSAFVIDAGGAMQVCLDLPQPGIAVRVHGFGSAWAGVIDYVRRAPGLSAECLNCDAVHYCAICPAWSSLENGELSGSVPYLCSIAKERKMRYGS